MTQPELLKSWEDICTSLSAIKTIVEEPIDTSKKSKEELKKQLQVFRKDLFRHLIAVNKTSIDINKYYSDQGII